MPRTPRILDPEGGIYHVLCRGNNKSPIFHDAHDFRAFLSLLAESKKLFRFALHHYVLMTNHVHLMIAPTAGSSLPEIMKMINHGFSIVHKQKYGRVGHLWQDRYKSQLITDDAYLLTAGIYIDLNPVRAGMVATPERYPWSSYRHYAMGIKDPVVTNNPLFATLGKDARGRRVAYRSLANMWLAKRKFSI
jgi:putative transposase